MKGIVLLISCSIILICISAFVTAKSTYKTTVKLNFKEYFMQQFDLPTPLQLTLIINVPTSTSMYSLADIFSREGKLPVTSRLIEWMM